MRSRLIPAITAMLISTAVPCAADTLELKGGGAIQGKYVGGTGSTVNMETTQGVLSVPTADASSLRFSQPPPPPPVVVVAPPPAAGPVSVPAGSMLLVRMDSQVTSKDPSGKKFSGRLVSDLVAGNVVVARAGTMVIGQIEQSKQAGRLVGKSQLAMTLSGIDFGGKLVPILTTNFAETGKGSFKKTARNAAVGAVIGHQFDHDHGAGKGAAVGVGVSLIRQGDSVTVPPGAILEFRLIQPLSVAIGT